MFDRIAQWQPDQGAAVAARAVGALALAGLAVIHVVDLPGTLGPDRLVGLGYLGIIVAAVLVGGLVIARPHWRAWAAAGAGAGSAMGGHLLSRAPPGGLPGRPRGGRDRRGAPGRAAPHAAGRAMPARAARAP